MISAPPASRLPPPQALPAGRRLERVLGTLARLLATDLLNIPAQGEKAVHNLRRRAKKLRSLVSLAAGCTSQAGLDESTSVIRSIKNAYTGSRERGVVLSTAEKVGGRALTRLLKAAAPVTPAPPMAEAATLPALLSALPVHELSWSDLRDRCKHEEHTARRRWLQACDNPTAENLHACRKKTKALYFQLVFLRLLKGGRKRKIKLARRLSHHLGEHHDLHMLRLELEKRGCLSNGVARKIDSHQEKELHHITRLGRKLHGG